MERVCSEGKGKGRMRYGRKDEQEGEGEGKKEEKEKQKMEKAIHERHRIFPSTNLGNNMTPIKGRLGKNATPTSKNPTEPDQNLQMNPPLRRSSFEIASRMNLVYTP